MRLFFYCKYFEECLDGYKDTFNVGITTYVWNKLFRAEIVKEAQKKVDERITIGEDAAITYPAILKSKRVYICDNSSYHYRQHEGSMLKTHHSFESEKEKLQYLDEYLKSIFEKDSSKDILLPQLADYIDSYLIIRSGGIMDGKSLFAKEFKGKNVVIIMAGTFGQVMYERLSNYCKIVGWYDEDYWEYRRCGMNVDPLENIRNAKFDYALIAKMDKENIDKIQADLAVLGVEEEKCLSIKHFI